jgi:hypothetical protein
MISSGIIHGRLNRIEKPFWNKALLIRIRAKFIFITRKVISRVVCSELEYGLGESTPEPASNQKRISKRNLPNSTDQTNQFGDRFARIPKIVVEFATSHHTAKGKGQEGKGAMREC